MDTYSHWQRRKPSEWLYPLTSYISPSGILGVGILHKCIIWWFLIKQLYKYSDWILKCLELHIYIYICIINNDMKLNTIVSKNTLLVSAIIMCSFFYKMKWWMKNLMHPLFHSLLVLFGIQSIVYPCNITPA